VSDCQWIQYLHSVGLLKASKIMGYRDLWTLEAILNDAQPATGQVAA